MEIDIDKKKGRHSQWIKILMFISLFLVQDSCAFPPPRPMPIRPPVYRGHPAPRVVPVTPVGRVVSILPPGYVAFMIGGALYYSCSGIFYRKGPSGYVVVSDPTTNTVKQQASVITEITVVADMLNMRTGPGKKHHIISSLRRGTVASVIGQTGEWYYIQLANGDTGWIMEKFTKVLIPQADG